MINEDKKIAISYGRNYVRNKQIISHEQATINNYARLLGFSIEKHYHDIGYVGNFADRSQLKMMLEELQQLNMKQVNYLLIYSADRLVRDRECNIRTVIEIMNYIDIVVLVSERVTYTSEDFKVLATTTLIRPNCGVGFYSTV